MKTRTKVIIAIGSNRNQEENVSKAYEHLKNMFKNSLFGPRMWTEPIGLENSDKFLNQVMLGRPSAPRSLCLPRCEVWSRDADAESVAPDSKVDVPLDLDLLLYGDEKLHESEWSVIIFKSSISYLEETDAKRIGDI